MHGVCGDALNPSNRPTPSALRELGLDSVRLVAFHEHSFWDYYTGLKVGGFKIALVFAGESFLTNDFERECASYGQRMAAAPPDLIILGNEPNATPVAQGGSSWITYPSEYVKFYDAAVAGFRSTLQLYVDAPAYAGASGVLISTAGLVGAVDPLGSGWFDQVIPHLDMQPDYINVHYPDNEAVLEGWSQYGIPLICGEWCYTGRGATNKTVSDWLAVLKRRTAHNFWFCYGYRKDMAVVSPTTGRKLAAFGHLQYATRTNYPTPPSQPRRATR